MMIRGGFNQGLSVEIEGRSSRDGHFQVISIFSRRNGAFPPPRLIWYSKWEFSIIQENIKTR